MTEQQHIDQRALDLINGGLDGELSSGELTELEQLLGESESVHELNADLKSLTGLLDNLPELNPPQYLQESIERQIRLPAQLDQHDEKRGFFDTWLPSHWMRTGFALTLGAVLTVSVYEMGSKPMTAEDIRNLSGTVVGAPLDSQGELIDSIDISSVSVTGNVELRNASDLFTLDVQLNSDVPTQLVVDFAGRGLDFTGVTRMQDGQDTVSITDGTVNIETSGEQRYTMSFRMNTSFQEQTTTPLKLDFFANQLLIHEAQLSITQE
jgi:hypothetical protein